MKEKGFTLIELMVVIAIIGIMAAFSVPNLLRGLPTTRLKSSADDLRGKLMVARAIAIGEGVPYIALFTENSNSFTIIKDLNANEAIDDGEPTTTYKFESGIVSDQVPENGIVIFSPRGEALIPGDIRLTNVRNERIFVHVVTSGSVIKEQ